MTAEDLGKILSISGPTVSRWESGAREPSFADLERWAQALGVAISITLVDLDNNSVHAVSDTEGAYNASKRDPSIAEVFGLSAKEAAVAASILRKIIGNR